MVVTLTQSTNGYRPTDGGSSVLLPGGKSGHHQRQQTGMKNIEISQQSENYFQLPPQLRGDSLYCHVQTAIAAMGGSALRH